MGQEPDVWFSSQSVSTQTAFAQLEQTAAQLNHHQLAKMRGSFSQLSVKGKAYWYYSFHDALDGKKKRAYVGPDNETVRQLVHTIEQGKAQGQGLLQSINRLVKIACAAGAVITPTYHLKLIRQLADYGFFHAGGILVGSHAFTAYANMLGIKWSSDAFSKTLDVDFAHAGRSLSLALPSDIDTNIAQAVESLSEGFTPLIARSKRSGTWVHPQDPDYQIDFLTPRTKNDDPIEFPRLGITLKPLKFMEFSMEDIHQTVLFDRSSAVQVSLPNPARYAVHKLIVYGERSGPSRLKAQKDLMQAAALCRALYEQRPQDLIDAWSDAMSRGPGWRKRLTEGFDALNTKYPQNALGALSALLADQKSREGAPAEPAPPRWMRQKD